MHIQEKTMTRLDQVAHSKVRSSCTFKRNNDKEFKSQWKDWFNKRTNSGRKSGLVVAENCISEWN